METTKVSISGWVDKGNVESKLDIGIYTMEYYSAIKNNNKILPLMTTCMGITLSEISQIEKEKHSVWYHMQNLKKKNTNSQKKEYRLVVDKVGVWAKWVVTKHKLPVTRYILGM